MGFLESLKQIFGLTPGVDFEALIAGGAKIIDVRSPGEFSGGHVKGSVNIPLGMLAGKVSKMKKDQPIITCCASGMRSRSAKAMLQSQGFTNVHNGGSWHSLNKYI
ncbi:rhodanese-like domain-containing protein [Mucilaginibacter gotjawali]|uniref:Rhodanese-related sulfurtransferase n=1 Tax=Mucilaginibacter gotjawali TaxID=1550579 RepID=A0A839SIB6_9SPHI|nr:rhodanese-like domain-containing protein [Mucilaginibacter gotjawali]MBB3057024.1 rhodanese-related sulfurtransferase [Mucilaginibacter gotjawali]